MRYWFKPPWREVAIPSGRRRKRLGARSTALERLEDRSFLSCDVGFAAAQLTIDCADAGDCAEIRDDGDAAVRLDDDRSAALAFELTHVWLGDASNDQSELMITLGESGTSPQPLDDQQCLVFFLGGVPDASDGTNIVASFASVCIHDLPEAVSKDETITVTLTRTRTAGGDLRLTTEAHEHRGSIYYADAITVVLMDGSVRSVSVDLSSWS